MTVTGDWTVYILRCADGSLYTGVAIDVRARVATHNAGKGASAVIGPLVYGIIADFTTERLAIAMVGIFFLLGLLILRGVREPERKNTTQASGQ